MVDNSPFTKALKKLRELSDATYEVCLLTGSGFGPILELEERHFELNYSEIPQFPVSTVEGHSGRLIGGRVGKQGVLIMDGRFHLYEGYAPQERALPIRTVRLMGAQYLFITSAAGGLDLDFRQGDLMLIRDHINLTGQNPLIGRNLEEFGPRFPDMTRAYPGPLRGLAKEVASRSQWELKEGAYVAV
jgi:purine-nucleoside phosphorylase